MNSPFDRFEDFDQGEIYKRYEAALLEPGTQNVIIDFDNTTALASINVDYESVKKILQIKRSGSSRTQWIILLGPHRQIETVKALAEHYEFSPRLCGLMCSDPNKPNPYSPALEIAGYSDQEDASQHHSHRTSQSDDPEKRAADVTEQECETLDLNHYRFINYVWHFNSVDFGPKSLCIGYNSLSNPKVLKSCKTMPEPSDAVDPKEGLGHRPDGTRLWTWLVICNDGTIISMHENPLPIGQAKSDPNEERNKRRTLVLGRQSLLNSFSQLSKSNEQRKSVNPFMTLGIRSGSQATDGSLSDAPGLLFYYLFDDWYSTYSLVIRDKNQYTVKLEQLRNQMMKRPNVELVGELHSIGRQLALLKRMYNSYNLIIDRILEKQKPIDNSIERRPSSKDMNGGQPLDGGPLVTREITADPRRLDDSGAPQTLGVRLSEAAAVRFQRLRDRIDLYALSEIQECLDEKESLVFMNFNLITLAESGAIERLTRITILLAKVTILFMPVSLMTAYFSVQVKGIEGAYNIQTYWGSFGVVMLLSFFVLLGFERISDSLDRSHKSSIKDFYYQTKAAEKTWRNRKKTASA